MEEDKIRNRKFNIIIGCLILALIIAIVFQMYNLKYGINYSKLNESNVTEKITVLNENIAENQIEVVEQKEVEENISQENSVMQNNVAEPKSNVEKVIDKIYFKDYAEASIYKVGEFTRETIPNDLILRLGFAKALQKLENKQVEEKFPNHEINKIEIEKGIKELFGNDIKYKHDKFINIDVETFNGFHEIRDTVKPVDNKYEFIYFEGGGVDTPFIHQEIYDTIETENKIEIKMKVAYVDTVFDETQKEGFCKYHFYKDFDFNTDEFKNELLVIEDNEYYESYENWYVDNYNPNKSLSNIIEKLDTYSYIFEKDNNTGEFYLSEFHKNQM